jgi:hypothetical protein
VSTKSTLTINPHPDEVDDVRWVKPFELIEMFDDSSLLFSPWFRIIAGGASPGGLGGSTMNKGMTGIPGGGAFSIISPPQTLTHIMADISGIIRPPLASSAPHRTYAPTAPPSLSPKWTRKQNPQQQILQSPFMLDQVMHIL